MTDRKEAPTEDVTKVAAGFFGQRTPTCGSFMQRPSETLKSHSPKPNSITSSRSFPKDYGLCTRPDHGFCRLLGYPFWRFKGQACLLIYSIMLAKSFLTNSSSWAGRPPPYCSHGHHVGPSPRGQETSLPVPRLISGEVAHRDEGSSSLQGIQKWRFTPIVFGMPGKLYLILITSLPQRQPHHLPPLCGRAQDPRSPSPNRRSQTPGSSNSECYFHKRFGPAANNCRPPCHFQDRRRKN